MSTQTQYYDVVIIGAGPSGAVAASLLVNKGWKVLVLEQQCFPRFSIGESLLPQCMSYLEEAQMLDVVLDNAEDCTHRYDYAERLNSLSEISYMLGFSDVTAFHRAFKRWTDQTPREYRRRSNHRDL